MKDEPEIVVDFAAASEVVPLRPPVQAHVDPLQSGFLWYTPPMASPTDHQTSGHHWMIAGRDMQILTTTVPAGETVTLEPGGYHVMFVGLAGDPFEVGDAFPATLVFEKAGEIEVVFEVEKRNHTQDHSNH